MYKLIKNINTGEINLIERLINPIFIPLNQENKDYQEYLRWVEEGNTPLPPDPEPEPLTAQQKLEAAGLTIEELKDLLGL